MYASYRLKTGSIIKAVLKLGIRETNMQTGLETVNKNPDSTKVESFHEKFGMQSWKCYKREFFVYSRVMRK